MSGAATANGENRKKSFVRHALSYGIGTGSVQIVGVVLLPLYTRHLEPAEYGVLQMLYRIGEFLNICLMINGIHLATLNLHGQVQDDRHKRPIAVSVAVVIGMALLLGGVVIVALSGPLSDFMSVENATLFACGVLTVMLQGAMVMPLAMMQARLESRRYAIITVSMSLCQVVLAVTAVAVLGWGIWGVVAALAGTFGGFGLVLTLLEVARARVWPERDIVKHVLRFASPFIPAGLFFLILYTGDQFFLMRMSGPSVLGIYALGYRIAMTVTQAVVKPLEQVWGAWMYEAYKRPNGEELLGKTITRMLGAYMFAGLVLVVFQGEVLAVLGSESYFEAKQVIGLLVLANFFIVGANFMDVAFYVRNRTSLKPWIAAGSAAMILVLYAVLVPRYDALGAAWATLLGFVIHAILTTRVARRVYAVTFEHRRLTVGLVLAVAIAIGAQWLGSGLWTFPTRLALCALWPATLWWMGAVSDEEKAFVARGYRRAQQYAHGLITKAGRQAS